MWVGCQAKRFQIGVRLQRACHSRPGFPLRVNAGKLPSQIRRITSDRPMFADDADLRPR